MWIDRPNLMPELAQVANPGPNIVPNIESEGDGNIEPNILPEGDDNSEGVNSEEAVRVPTHRLRHWRNADTNQRWTRGNRKNSRLCCLSTLLGDITKPTDAKRKQFACTMGK